MSPKSIPSSDEWGHDPQVCYLRGVFSRLESTQRRLFEKLNVEPLNGRLRIIRERALNLFEKAWGKSQQQGLALQDDELELLYLMCLADLCRSQGMNIPAGIFPLNEKIENLFKEITS